MIITENNEFKKWLKNLEKLGAPESSVLFVIYGENTAKEKLVEEITYSIWNLINKSKTMNIEIFIKNNLPKYEIENKLIIIDNFTEPFSLEKANQLFAVCPQNIIVFLQQEKHIDNIDPDFIDNYCTVVVYENL